MYTQLLKKFEEERGFISFQIRSFNKFIENDIQTIMSEIGEVNLTPETNAMKLLFGEVELGKPVIKEADGSTRQIYPNEARIRNLTYSTPIFVYMIPVVEGVKEKPEKVHIIDMPIMVKSKLCSTSGLSKEELTEKGEDPEDLGGYFIVNGTERAVVMIEEIANNIPIFENDNGLIKVRINSERSGFKQKHLVEMKPDGEITITFANIRRLPIVTLLKALGMETDKQICDNVSQDEKVLNEFYINLYKEEVITTEDSKEAIGKRLKIAREYRDERINQILDKYLLPHIGQTPEERSLKAMAITRIIRKSISLYLGEISADDIDHYSNKRLLMAGDLLGQLFRSILLGRWGLIAKMNYNYQKLVKRGRTPSIQGIVEADAATKQILSSIATGNWIGGRTGVSQRLDRSSYVRTISHLRSIVSPLTSTQEHFSAREIHPTEWGKICPAETPEGSSIGLRKHLAILAEITAGMSPEESEKVSKFIQAL
ncbi:MAG: DNA-directed RNA polymerase subunit B'' [Candidatus Aenigmarchaeota archaeon]|nr:DNA-directed RNA polymerase subunit B'' [Candidatus Aenigmarchaeota archaeon]